MQYNTLGRTGVKVSSLCYGTMAFGGDADEATSGQMYRYCRALGINFFDTANIYSNGRSEEILGRLIRGERDELVITSKVCGPMGDGPNDRGLSRRHIVQAVEASLRRLQTDRLDLYFVHNFDEGTPMEETLAALNDLVRRGKISLSGREQLGRLANCPSPRPLRPPRAGILCVYSAHVQLGQAASGGGNFAAGPLRRLRRDYL